MTRNYRKERQAYYGYGKSSSVTPTQKRHRREMASRKKARAALKPKKGMEVDHKDGNPLNNKRSNLQVITRHANRSKH
tara:strand:+ start:6669 stop:6902 length:234 start_codon:yes stop_codon:yes gene_type:complete